MTYRVLWSLEAGRNLLDIHDFIQANDPSAAQRIVAAIKAITLSLKTLPRRGKPGRKLGTRELVLPNLPWIINYSVDDRMRTVNILRLHHYAQRRD
ncbi:MAG: type II toxin-antitoxin system RelE/ParE family toxin [Alphaproteobacteria bacterium]|nr:type II toxin-antitoxin system RelE/ParE family toxin [Alphaproteobacteria bacterium]